MTLGGSEERMSLSNIVRSALASFFSHDMPTYAAALAYRSLLSLFPLFVLLISLLGLLGVPELFQWMREQAGLVLPENALSLVDSVISEIERPHTGIMSGAILMALWAASVAMFTIMKSLNVVFSVSEKRPAWMRLMLALALTIALTCALVLVAFVMVTGPAVLTWLTAYVHLDEYFIAVWTWLRWPILSMILILTIAVVYHAAPNTQGRFRILTAGAITAVAIWILASLVFGWYVSNFANYSKTYGSIGAVIVLLLYFFLSAAVVLFGAEINASVLRSKARDPLRTNQARE